MPRRPRPRAQRRDRVPGGTASRRLDSVGGPHFGRRSRPVPSSNPAPPAHYGDPRWRASATKQWRPGIPPEPRRLRPAPRARRRTDSETWLFRFLPNARIPALPAHRSRPERVRNNTTRHALAGPPQWLFESRDCRWSSGRDSGGPRYCPETGLPLPSLGAARTAPESVFDAPSPGRFPATGNRGSYRGCAAGLPPHPAERAGQAVSAEPPLPLQDLGPARWIARRRPLVVARYAS